MPRKSAASLSVIAGTIDGRPQPPADLTAFQQKVWRETVASEAAPFFRTAALQQLLKEYCRHVESASILAQLIDSFDQKSLVDDEGVDRYAKLLKMRDLEARAVSEKATKLRLTNQSRYTPQAAATASKTAGAARKPWEMAG